jgi:hypothetical protein
VLASAEGSRRRKELYFWPALTDGSPAGYTSSLRDNDHFGRDAAAVLRARSVMNWPEQIGVPLLIIHGANDQEVPAVDAMAFGTRLAELRKRYQLIVYADDVTRPRSTGAIATRESSRGSGNSFPADAAVSGPAACDRVDSRRARSWIVPASDHHATHVAARCESAIERERQIESPVPPSFG